MLAVIDTLRNDQQAEIDKFHSTVARHKHLPFNLEETHIFELQESAIADTEGTYPSDLIASANLPNPEVQRAVVHRSNSALDRYRRELETLTTNPQRRAY